MLLSFVHGVIPRVRTQLRHRMCTRHHRIITAKNGASIALFERATLPTRVLLVRRGKAPNKGLWSLPGGRVNDGELLRDAVLRELEEETSIAATDLVISREHLETLSFPLYTVHIFAGILKRPIVPICGDDAEEAGFFDVGVVHNLERTEGLENVLERAIAKLPQLQLV